MKNNFLFLILFGLILISGPTLGQTESVIASENEDTPAPKPSLEENIKRIQQFNITINSLDRALEFGVDTAQVNSILPTAERVADVIKARLDSQETRINLRYLNALENLLASIRLQLAEIERPVMSKMEQLMQTRLKLDSIRQDKIWEFPREDSFGFNEYRTSVNELSKRLTTVEKELQESRTLNASYQSRIARLNITLAELGERIQIQRKELTRSLFDQETNYIWQKRDFPDTERLIDVFKDSLRFNALIVTRYIKNHLPITFFLLIIVGAIYYWTKKNIKKIENEKEFASIILGRLVYINKFTLLASALPILTIAPFFYTTPPVTFFAIIIFLMVSISGVLLINRIEKNAYRVWLALYVLFIFSLFSNLYWKIAYNERWHLLVFGSIALLLGIQFRKVIANHQENKLPKYLLTIANAYILFQAIGLAANILGRFSLGKMIGIAATLSLMHAISLLVFLVTIKEIIYLQIEVSRKNQSEFTSMIDFKDIQERITKLFSLLAIAIWGYLFFESLSLLDTVLDEVSTFLSKPRTIINVSFTFGQVVVFILVVYVTSFIANTTAYFASIKDQQYAAAKKKRLGSAILLLRLGILSIGFLIAIAASGIPVDKIAIVLGALSVGIGFGLQTIVNNLVSGVILAFEKPIQVGDIIQVGLIEGTVTDIGIRASKIKNYDGAEIIIPNGDLLAQHLTNWTLSDKQRRVELMIGVDKGSDLDQVTELIQEQLKLDGIQALPIPRVFLQSFSENQVTFRVLFWVEDIDVWIMLRDEVMRAIFKTLKENNINIPLPQRDLHIKTFPGLLAEEIKRASDIDPKENQEPIQ